MSTWYRIKLLLIFALAGPIVGGLVACPITACLTGSCVVTPDDPHSGVLATITFCAILGPLGGFVLGIVPAAVTGAVLAWVAPPPDSKGLAKAAVVATLVTIAYGVLYFSRSASGGEDRDSVIAFGSAMLAAGIVSGIVCWGLVVLTSKKAGPR